MEKRINMPPVVSLIKCDSYDRALVRSKVEELLQPLGGIEKFVKRGDRVLLKPNLVMSGAVEKALTTHPEVVRAVAELVRDCGAVVMAGDSPGVGSAAKVAASCGIKEAVESAGGKIIEFSLDESDAAKEAHKADAAGGALLGASDIAREVHDCDFIINLPKFKTHGLATLTLGVKNCFGYIVGSRKFQWHYRAGHNCDLFCKMLIDVWSFARPGLTLMDAVIGMEGDGPTAGTPCDMGFLAASADTLALDATCARIVGVDPLGTPVLKGAYENFEDQSWLDPELIGGTIADYAVENYTLPSTRSFQDMLPPWLGGFARKYLTAWPEPIRDKCVACGVCARSCPAQAITMIDKLPSIDTNKCIRCYCCHELCPHDAFVLKRTIFGRMIDKLVRRA